MNKKKLQQQKILTCLESCTHERLNQIYIHSPSTLFKCLFCRSSCCLLTSFMLVVACMAWTCRSCILSDVFCTSTVLVSLFLLLLLFYLINNFHSFTISLYFLSLCDDLLLYALRYVLTDIPKPKTE